MAWSRDRTRPSYILEVPQKIKKPSSRDCLAANLLAARTMLGWSQADLALKCGFPKTYLGNLERGEFNLGLENLDKLARCVGISSHVLLLPPQLAYPHIHAATLPAAPTTKRSMP